jgi:DNA-binding NarL/FixJ family response regulator
MIAEFPDPGRLPAIAATVEQDLTAGRASAGNGRSSSNPARPSSPCCGLATGLSRREIGEHLYISLNTVKTRTRELYRKLGASSRADAVAGAEALGLLDLIESPG